MQIQWNANAAPDTYGYVVYTYDANGFLIELDTIYGQNNTSYLYSVPFDGGPYTYTVAAFDSCFTSNNPPSFQTSAKANLHTSIQASYLIDMCPQRVDLTWSTYGGTAVVSYEIWSKHNNSWALLGTSTDTTASINLVKNENPRHDEKRQQHRYEICINELPASASVSVRRSDTMWHRPSRNCATNTSVRANRH